MVNHEFLYTHKTLTILTLSLVVLRHVTENRNDSQVQHILMMLSFPFHIQLLLQPLILCYKSLPIPWGKEKTVVRGRNPDGESRGRI